ncbi:hypothetical protein [Vampirovibrio sp.]|uniref:hypothetical protein n=1 Tax=Vampirovibrio sp. TaxID=2717857 RepID=UPI0035947BC6
MFSASRFWLLLLLCMGLLGTLGCQQTQTAKPTPSISPVTGPPAFGSFNLHKRHGLGGWQGQTMPSQTQWLKSLPQKPELSP